MTIGKPPIQIANGTICPVVLGDLLKAPYFVRTFDAKVLIYKQGEKTVIEFGPALPDRGFLILGAVEIETPVD